MAISTNGTKLNDLFNPQVVGDMIDKKLTDAIKFSPLCVVDTTLRGRPGDTLTLPSYAYIGDAEDVEEGADTPIAKLTESTADVKVKKAGKGVEISDEAILSGYGQPADEAVSQLILSIASKVDNDTITTLDGIAVGMTQTKSTETFPETVNDALEKFGEDIDGEKVLLVSPAEYTVLRKAEAWLPASEIASAIIIKGAVGEIYGCQVVVTNKLKGKNKAFIVKPGALRLILKRDTLVETDRDIIAKTNIITADKHYATYLYNPSKAIKIALA